MSRTVTALFDSRSEADAARQRLSQSSIDADNVRIIDQNSAGGSGSSGEGHGLWASIKSAFIPEEDSHTYEEGIRRGGSLLCAQVDEDQADRAVEILDSSNSVDLEERQNSWRSEGWAGYQPGADEVRGSSAGSTSASTGSTQGFASTQGFSGTQQARAPQTASDTVSEQRIPIIEEELKVGKREVTRGGARVRSYISETPVREQINLREEHVSVERRPVDEKLSQSDLQSGDLLREQEIEMTETAEEAVVAKEARVREEVVLRKTAEERTETIEDTVRRTEVDVDEGLQQGGGDRSAFGSFGGGTGSGQSSEPGRSESLQDSESRNGGDRY
jgi:uncharacterized protein (TIGR02271 family)